MRAAHGRVNLSQTFVEQAFSPFNGNNKVADTAPAVRLRAL